VNVYDVMIAATNSVASSTLKPWIKVVSVAAPPTQVQQRPTCRRNRGDRCNYPQFPLPPKFCAVEKLLIAVNNHGIIRLYLSSSV